MAVASRIAAAGLLLVSAAFGSQADALAIDRNIQAKHLPWGTIVDPVYAAIGSNQIATYTHCGDSALWTGNYLAAESYRYAVTQSAEALANVKAAVAGIQSLVDVTGTNVLARCRVPIGSPYFSSIQAEENHNGIYTNSTAGYYWVGNTSRDEYSGVFFGLALAWDLVPDAAVRAAIQPLVDQLLDYLISHLWTVVMPDGSIPTTFIVRPDQQLTFLQIGRHIDSGRYGAVYNANAVVLAASVLTPIAVDDVGNDSYFKFNLDYINLFDLIRLETNSVYRAAYLPAYTAMRVTTAGHQNAFFNVIDLALTGANATRDQQTISYLNDWLKRPSRDLTVDLRGQLPSCGNANEACDPVPIQKRPNTDFLWQRDPFLLYAPGDGTRETAGIDYILPFWMARYYGIADGASVVSAATGGAVTAPESIASFYGSNLATGTAQATSLPLPANLAGSSVQLTDGAGTTVNAPLFYVSPGQINFEIPAGIAAGRVTVSVLEGGTAVATTTANVQTIAPTLFTADSTGTGLAAAYSTPPYISLFGTGIRNRSSPANVTATVNGVAVSVLYAGAQGTDVGLDQVNIQIPAALQGAGNAVLQLTVDGQTANPVRINVQ